MRASEVTDHEGDSCIRGPGLWVAHRARRRVWPRGIGDPHAIHGRLINARNDQALAVGRPPVTTVTTHFFCRDEFRPTPADEIATAVSDRRDRAIFTADVEFVAGDVRHPSAAGTEAGIEHRRTARGDVARFTAHDVGNHEPAVEDEDRRSHVCVAGIRDDSTRTLAGALAAGSLEIRFVGIRTERPCVNDASLCCGRDVEDPQ